ncbi:chromosome transmission fidelity protein 4 [Rhizophagus clarus]|nr:chromosome transmission fidelity protein 4 [Rhizophagus clarus]
MDVNEKIEVESREEISHEPNDIEIASISKPQDDKIIMDTSMDDNTDSYSYVDSDEDDPVLKSRLKSLKKQYKGGSNGSDRSQAFKSKTPEQSNGSARSQSKTSSSYDLAKIRENMKKAEERLHKREKKNLTSKFLSSHLNSREKGSPKKKHRTTIDNDDGVEYSSPKPLTAGRKNEFDSINFDAKADRKNEFDSINFDEESTSHRKSIADRKNEFESINLFDEDNTSHRKSIADRKNEFESINLSDEERNTFRRKSTGSLSDADDEGFNNFHFSDDENTKKRSSDNLNGDSSNDELSLNDEFSTISKKKFKHKSNSFRFLDDPVEESADEDYVPAISIDNKEDKTRDEPNRRESSYLDTDDDDLGEVFSGGRKSKDGEIISPENSLPKSVSTDKATEGLMEFDLESILNKDVDLDDYVAVDKPRYSPKKNQQQRQIIIHEESSNITELQPPFQPGSSPMKNGRRYLAVNWLGCIHAVNNTTFHSVNVEYNNKTQFRGYNFHDDVGYTMACLGAHGVLFAVGSDSGNPSILYYKPNNSWGPKGEWMSTLPEGEDIIAIALSDKAIAIATSKNYLRFFSLFGFQNYIFAFPSIVCMAAYDNLLLVAYHLSVAHKGSQNLGYVLYDMHDRGDIQKDVLPISKESTLRWLGFSEEGLPAMFDSKGVLYILHDHRMHKQARWVPVLDTTNIVKEPKSDADSSKSLKRNSDIIDLDEIPENKAEKDEEKEIEEKEKEKEKEWIYWPVAVMESKLMCFILKYGEDVPRYPRPAYDEINWQIPLLHLDNESGRYEERWMRESIISSFQYQEAKAKNELNEEKIIQLKKKERDANKIIIELIMTSVGEEKYERALGLAKLLNSVKFLDSALKIAEFYRVPNLAEKINKLKSEKIKERERSILRRKERQNALSNKTTSHSQPLTNTDASIYVSDFNHNNVGESSQYEGRQISSLKRSAKDMNDEKKQENKDLSKPKKSAAPISSYFLKKSTFAAISSCSNTNPSVVDDEKPAAISKERSPKKRMKEKNDENKYSQDQNQENEAGHDSEQNKEEHERTNDKMSESYLMDNKSNISNEVPRNNIEVNELIIDKSMEESNNMDIDVEKEVIECFD